MSDPLMPDLYVGERAYRAAKPWWERRASEVGKRLIRSDLAPIRPTDADWVDQLDVNRDSLIDATDLALLDAIVEQDAERRAPREWPASSPLPLELADIDGDGVLTDLDMDEYEEAMEANATPSPSPSPAPSMVVLSDGTVVDPAIAAVIDRLRAEMEP